ncbi:DUF2975 domain-containing protein [Vagococcus penaei]|uniref:DUF2975 domain-containing protein n=2 Tax=Vagococcus penaei TaxID=633807 RepID=A0A1Q2D6H6_9ENTE|nr:DUF2975 domain-containing protein [Vagococcus penaei]AQP53924.1 hypothetical protein BW732_06620 [Vagococcus penaei]
MNFKKINTLFRVALSLVALLGLGFLLLLAPKMAHYFSIQKYNLFLQLFFWITALPVYYILFSLWRISTDLKHEKLFTPHTQKRLKTIAYAGIGESVFYALLLICGLIFLKANMPFYLLSGLFFLIGIIIAIIATLLFHLFTVAEQLKQDSDLTI